MHPLARILSIGLIPLFGTWTAKAATLVAAEDTFITKYAALGGPTSTHGGDTYLGVVGDDIASGADSTKSLLKFDLSSYSGQTLAGDATFAIHVTGSVSAVTRTISIYNVLIPWSQGTLSWNDFGVTSGVDFGTDVASSASTSLSYTPSSPPEFISFTLPQALVQAWIDSPGANYGILLDMPLAADVYFDSSEQSTASLRPTLTFAVVPEPSSAAILILGAAVALAGRRRR